MPECLGKKNTDTSNKKNPTPLKFFVQKCTSTNRIYVYEWTRDSLHSIVIHPQYDDANIDFDYAVITLNTEINFSLGSTRHIRPICPPMAPVQGGQEVSQ